MKLIEYVEKIQQVKNEIVGCDNLIEFYTHKKALTTKNARFINDMENN